MLQQKSGITSWTQSKTHLTTFKTGLKSYLFNKYGTRLPSLDYPHLRFYFFRPCARYKFLYCYYNPLGNLNSGDLESGAHWNRCTDEPVLPLAPRPSLISLLQISRQIIHSICLLFTFWFCSALITITSLMETSNRRQIPTTNACQNFSFRAFTKKIFVTLFRDGFCDGLPSLL